MASFAKQFPNVRDPGILDDLTLELFVKNLKAIGLKSALKSLVFEVKRRVFSTASEIVQELISNCSSVEAVSYQMFILRTGGEDFADVFRQSLTDLLATRNVKFFSANDKTSDWIDYNALATLDKLQVIQGRR